MAPDAVVITGNRGARRGYGRIADWSKVPAVAAGRVYQWPYPALLAGARGRRRSTGCPA